MQAQATLKMKGVLQHRAHLKHAIERQANSTNTLLSQKIKQVINDQRRHWIAISWWCMLVQSSSAVCSWTCFHHLATSWCFFEQCAIQSDIEEYFYCGQELALQSLGCWKEPIVLRTLNDYNKNKSLPTNGFPTKQPHKTVGVQETCRFLQMQIRINSQTVTWPFLSKPANQ